MDIAVIKQCSEASMSENMPFPEVVIKLVKAGTERYLADLVGLNKYYYGVNNEIYVHDISAELPQVGQNFNKAEIKNALMAIQQSKIGYETFLKRIMLAGCCHYEVYLHGKKAIYFGRAGDHYIEVFPNK